MNIIKLNEIAIDFLILCSKGDSRKAFELYTHHDLIHHNPFFKGDANSLMIAMEEDAEGNANKSFEINNVLNDNGMVAVHSHIRQDKNDAGYAVVHLLKFEEGKIVELWDVVQQVPDEIINKNGMF